MSTYAASNPSDISTPFFQATIHPDKLAELAELLAQARSRNNDGLSKAEGAESLRRRLDVDDTLSLATVKVKRLRGGGND